jgi:archaellum biogenesis ATPase FlaH
MQAELLESLCQNFATNEYRLLIIDSVMALFRSDFVGRGELSERQQVLNSFLRRATQMAEEFNLAVLMVRLATFTPVHTTDTRRPTKSCLIPVQALCSQESMAVSPLGVIFLHMLLLLDFCFAKVGARNGLQRL